MTENYCGNPIRLTSLDCVFVPLFGLWVYDTKLDIKLLQSSLDVVIKRDLPVLSSVMRKINGEKYSYIQPVSPSNVKIEEQVINEDLHNLYLPDSNGLLSHSEGKKLSSYFGKINWNEARSSVQPKLYTPLLKIILLQTPSKKSVLTVSIPHSICDAFSLASFMNIWDCEITNSPNNRIVKDFNHSRNLIPTENFDMYKECSLKEMDFLKSYHPIKKIIEEEIGYQIIDADKCVNKLIHFTQSSLLKLKEEAKTNIKKGSIISSNDCICAYLWKLHTIITKKKVKSGIIPFKMVVDFRHIKDSPIGIGYFGNAVLTNMDYRAEEIMKMEYGEMVFKIRQLVNNTNRNVIQTCVDLQHYVFENEMTDIKSTFTRNTSLYTNDWRVFDRMRPKSCSRVIIYPQSIDKYFPQCIVVLMHPNDGLYCRMTFENEVFEKIKDLELNRLDSLKIIEERF